MPSIGNTHVGNRASAPPMNSNVSATTTSRQPTMVIGKLKIARSPQVPQSRQTR
jgi:hypothetical protein